jgi:hypothetical protein
LDAYVSHNEHVLYSELWVRDSDPTVNAYHGFIECYRDRSGVGREFAGFVGPSPKPNLDFCTNL